MKVKRKERNGKPRRLSRQIYAVPDLCCIVTWRSVESGRGVFDPFVSSAIAVFEHFKDKTRSNTLFAPSDQYHVRQAVDPSSPWGG